MSKHRLRSYFNRRYFEVLNLVCDYNNKSENGQITPRAEMLAGRIQRFTTNAHLGARSQNFLF
jgi:hypothetical protein